MLLNAPAVMAADTALSVFVNGNIFTGNPNQPEATAMVVQGHEIVFVGDDSGAREWANQDSRLIDLEGRRVLPGLIDAHTHPGYMAMTHDMVQLPESRSEAELLSHVDQALAFHPDKKIMVAMPWSNNLFDPEIGPDKTLLDALDNERPVLIWDDWMHALWVNSKALEVAGVDKSTPDAVPGFSFYQRNADGELTGYLTESVASDFFARFVHIDEASEMVMMDYLQYLQAHGVTTLFDAGNFGVDDEIYSVIRRWDDEGRLPVRYHGAYTLFLPRDIDSAVATLKRMNEQYSRGRVRIDTLKIFFDGVIETRTAAMTEDYLDTPGNRGQVLMDQRRLTQLILDLEREQLHLHVHTVGSEAIKIALDAVDAAQTTLGRALSIRVAMSHLEVMRDEDLGRFSELNVVGQFTPAWHGGDRGDHPGIGPLAESMMRAQPLIDSGARVSFSSDVYFPSDWVEGGANPFVGIQTGHNRQYPSEGPEGPVLLPKTERLTLKDLVMGYTTGAAWQLGMESQVGAISEGLKADFIVLDQDPFTIGRYDIAGLKPLAVFMDGILVNGGLESLRSSN